MSSISFISLGITVNSPVSVNASFIDTGTKDTHKASWDFGDGTKIDGVVTESNGSGTVTGTHIYTHPGVYSVSLTVTDKDGGVGLNVYQYIVIYNPTGGFITAAGYFESPAGAYVSDSQKTGDIKFGIDAKYKDNTPQGKTKLNFKDANFNFESTSYEWYTINTNKAQLKGTGTINSIGSYIFLITMIDSGLPEGQHQDKLHIKITDTNGQLIYDNQPGSSDTADPTVQITNGAIKVHQ